MNSPAFQFYPADWLADEAIQTLSIPAEGLYIRLVCYCWREGSIPADRVAIGRLCKGYDGVAIDEVLPLFKPSSDSPGRLINPRLEAERVRQVERKMIAQESGTKGATSRWGGHGNPNRVRNMVAMATPIGLDSSSSSSSSSINTPIVPKGTEWNPDEFQVRLGALFRRRPETPWSEKERKAYKAAAVQEGDLELVERYYSASIAQAFDYRRRDLCTLLNNFPGEVDRARNFKPKSDKLW